VYFKDLQSYGAYFGGFSSAGNYASEWSVRRCWFENVHGQNVGGINCENGSIEDNWFLKIQLEAGVGHISLIDMEPNIGPDRMNNIKINGNDFDGRDALQLWNAIVVQAAGNNTGCDHISITRNYIRGLGVGGIKVSNGIYAAGLTNSVLEDNVVHDAGQSGVHIDNSHNVKALRNTLHRCGSGGVAAFGNTGTSRSFFDNNIIDGWNGTFNLEESRFKELELTGTCDTNGLDVVRLTGPTALPHWIGKTITIDGVDVDVTAFTDHSHYAVGTNLGVRTGVTWATKFSSNTYTENAAGGYNLLGTSRVDSAKDRTVRPGFPASLFADTDNWRPTRYASRLLVTASGGSWTLSGMSFDDYPHYKYPVDGEAFTIYNAGGSNNITLLNEGAGSTAGYRFKTSTGADVVLSPKQAADIEYSLAAGRWLVFKRN
jgi:parallel beta-helix repeat protein